MKMQIMRSFKRRFCLVDGMTHERDGTQGIAGCDVRADITAFSRRLKQPIQCKIEVIHEVTGKIVERRVTRVRRRGETTLDADEFSEMAELCREGLPRLMIRTECRRCARACVDLLLQHGDDQIGTAKEVLVKRPDAGEVRNLLRRRVDTRSSEH